MSFMAMSSKLEIILLPRDSLCFLTFKKVCLHTLDVHLISSWKEDCLELNDSGYSHASSFGNELLFGCFATLEFRRTLRLTFVVERQCCLCVIPYIMNTDNGRQSMITKYLIERLFLDWLVMLRIKINACRRSSLIFGIWCTIKNGIMIVHPFVLTPSSSIHEKVANSTQIKAQLLGNRDLHLLRGSLRLLKNCLQSPSLKVSEHQSRFFRIRRLLWLLCHNLTLLLLLLLCLLLLLMLWLTLMTRLLFLLPFAGCLVWKKNKNPYWSD